MPAPAPAPTSLVDLAVSQRFVASVTGIQYGSATVTSNDGIAAVPTAPRQVLSFDAATGSYQFDVNDFPLAEAERNGQTESATFAPSSITDNGAASITAAVRSTFGAGQTGDRTLIRSRPGSANPELALLYAAFGSFEYVTRFRTTVDAHDYRPFAYGITTPASGVPTTGTATYRGIVAGRSIDGSGFAVNGVLNYDLMGTLVVTVDYARRAVSGSIVLQGRSIAAFGVPQGAPVPLGTVVLSPDASLATLARFEGGASFGAYEGFLAGPAGEELGLAVQAVVTDPRDPSRRQRVSLSGAARR